MTAKMVEMHEFPADSQVKDLDTCYYWPDRMTGTARERQALFAAEGRDDPAAARYVNFTQAEPVKPTKAAVDQIAAMGAFAEPEPEPEPEPEGRQPVRASRLPTNPSPGALAQFGVMDGPPSLLPDDDGLTELFAAVRQRRSVTVHTPAAQFATITTTQSGRDTQLLPVNQRAGAPRRVAELGRIPTEQVAWGAATAFPIMGAGTVPGVTGEGVAKPEYSAITAGSATPQTLAIWTDISNQALSLANFDEKLRNKLARLVALGENELLRAKVAGTAGVVTQTFTAGDQAVQILRSAAIIEAAVNMAPNLLLFNPADTLAIFGTAVSNSPGLAAIAELSMRMFNMIALPLNTQPAGFVLMGAWAAGSRLVVGLPPQYFTNPYTQAKNNITTVILEEAVDLAVEEPEAFRTVDIVTP